MHHAYKKYMMLKLNKQLSQQLAQENDDQQPEIYHIRYTPDVIITKPERDL